MRTQRRLVDYRLKRRALLREVYAGMVSPYEVCDASPYLKNAARYHGDRTETRCPICRREYLTLVHYIYGDELRHAAGQARPRADLAALAARLREFQVYVVEVCRGCDWNLLVEQYLLGSGDPAGAPARANGGESSATRWEWRESRLSGSGSRIRRREGMV